MATISSHILDATSGSSAVGIRAVLNQLNFDGSKTVLFDVKTNEEGRVAEIVDVNENFAGEYELVFYAADYFNDHLKLMPGETNMREVVLRFSMPDPDKRYHMPIMLSPHSYSVWWSE